MAVKTTAKIVADAYLQLISPFTRDHAVALGGGFRVSPAVFLPAN